MGQESLLKGLVKASLAVLVEERMKNCIAENAHIAQDQGDYQISSEPKLCEAENVKVRGVCFTGKAADGLKKESCIDWCSEVNICISRRK